MSIATISVSREALRSNMVALRGAAPPGVSVAAVVKGNAYGCGLDEAVNSIEDQADCFQVDDVEELERLRRLTRKRALVFGYVERDRLADAIQLGCEPAIFDSGHADEVGSAARKSGTEVTVHLKVDALLGRLGTLPAELHALVEALVRWPELKPASAYAHFGNIEDTTDLSHAQEQAHAFDVAWKQLRQTFPALGRHMSATSGLMADMCTPAPDDLVRLGIGLYGLYPSAALAKTKGNLVLRPVLAWKTLLAQVKTLPARHPVGYGLTYITSRPMRVGIVPQGYSDGYDRGLSNVGEVLVGSRRCPVLGRIAMNMFAVDLSEVPEAKREDEVVLLGTQGPETISPEELAAKLGTINYEVIARISPQIHREIV